VKPETTRVGFKSGLFHWLAFFFLWFGGVCVCVFLKRKEKKFNTKSKQTSVL